MTPDFVTRSPFSPEWCSSAFQGSDASAECRRFFHAPTDPFDVRKQLRHGNDNTTGGGGGGGGSFVFKVGVLGYGIIHGNSILISPPCSKV